MVNTLLITNNINFTKKLLTEMTANGLSLNILGIATTKAETFLALDKLDFDLIVLDKDLKHNFDKIFIKSYKDLIVTLSLTENSCLINTKTLKEIKSIIEDKDLEKRRERIIKELEYIGYKFKYKGTHYLVDTILLMYMRQDSMVDNLQSNIYPVIAEKYNKTIINVKSSINKATECMYYECDSKKLEQYFKFGYDSKPTVKQVVFAVVNRL